MSDRLTTPFGFESTAAEVIDGVDLTGRTAVVTGASSGIGVETARALAAAGASVTLAVRNTSCGDRVAGEIRDSTGNEGVGVGTLDLSDLSSVFAFVRAWAGPLHILVNNAGVMAVPELTMSPSGHEMQFASNHLGHFALAVGLHRALAAADGARIVSVSSAGHLRSPVVFDDIDYAFRDYDPFGAYGQSKTANVLFAVEATRRWADDGITANSLMPGAIFTRLGRSCRRQGRGRRHEAATGGQDRRAGRGDVGAAGRVTEARRHRRSLFRGLQRGPRRRTTGRAGPWRGCALCAGPGQRRTAVGRLAEDDRVAMPEGDTVWHTAAKLREALAGKTLTRCDVRVPRYATVDLTGQRVDEVVSRGKHLFIRVGEASIHSHLKMDGSWQVNPVSRPSRAGHRIRIILEAATSRPQASTSVCWRFSTATTTRTRSPISAPICLAATGIRRPRPPTWSPIRTGRWPRLCSTSG